MTAALRTLIRAAAAAKGQDGDAAERGPYLATSKVLL